MPSRKNLSRALAAFAFLAVIFTLSACIASSAEGNSNNGSDTAHGPSDDGSFEFEIIRGDGSSQPDSSLPASSAQTLSEIIRSTSEPEQYHDRVDPDEPVISSEEPAVSEVSSQPRVPNGKRVAFTFDDGPSAIYTRLIVDKLRQYDARATFFIVGNRVDDNTADAMRYALNNGCEIGIHGYTHKYSYAYCSDEVFRREVDKTAAVLRSKVGVEPTLLRPIGGAITKSRAAELPYAVINWTIDTNDWRFKKNTATATKQQNVDTIVKNALARKVRDGDIILMHEIYGNSYAAFCRIIETLYSQGYEFVTVTELLGDPKPGTLYGHPAAK